MDLDRAAVYGMAPLLVAMAFGLDPSWGCSSSRSSAWLTGLGFAGFGVFIAGVVDRIDNFNYVTSAVITPLFLVSGTFFRSTGCPNGPRSLANLNPLYHCVELGGMRSSASRRPTSGTWLALVAFALVMWRLAVWRLQKRLIA